MLISLRVIVATVLALLFCVPAFSDGNPTELSLDEIASVRSLLQFTRQAAFTEQTPESVAEMLVDLGLEPTIATEPAAGIPGLTVIRTWDTLVGTRYIHVQFEGDLVTNAFFEIRRTDDTPMQVARLVAEIFPDFSASQDLADGKLWVGPDCHILWLRPLTAEDMMNHPFNAYVPEDAGATRFGLEMPAHC